MDVRMGEPGQLIGVKDRNGREIRIGDKLRFDESAWGGKCEFEVGFEEGELSICGTISDLSNWCEVIDGTSDE